MYLTLGAAQLKVKKIPLLIWSISIILLVGLGVWQLNRAAEKQRMLRQTASAQSVTRPVGMSQQQLLALSEKQLLDAEGQLVELALNIPPDLLTSNQVWLLDNQIYQHVLGAHVIIQANVLNSRKQVLLDLGWVPYSKDRLPVLPHNLPQGLVELQAQIKIPSNNHFMSEIVERRDKWQFISQISPYFIQKLQQQKSNLLPILLISKANSDVAYQSNWRQVNMPPAKHYAYAVQWFALAIALTIIILIKATKWKTQQS
ncbi:SURF1 family protein [Catenovulum sediminis]|uniref:SURF1-like protein n=1 Tax=Catenovulum sediminis TaxID=1740262 RepID=A0ABV1RMA0_9ALTE|nr:SURF1 family protein [Catenovulum sediminis]